MRMTGRHTPYFVASDRCRGILLSLIFCCLWGRATLKVPAAEPMVSPSAPASHTTPHFYVRGYTVEGVVLSTNILIPLFSKYTGTNVSLQQIVHAATDLQSAYRNEGYPAMSVAFVPEEISDGIVTFNVAQTVVPQIVVAGERCLGFSNGVEIVSQPPATTPKPPVARAAPVIAPASFAVISQASHVPTRRASYPEMVDALAAMHLKMDELDMQARDTRVHVVSTNAGPRFEVKKYLVDGNSVLPVTALGQAITNIDGAFGTNVSFDGIQTVVSELGKAYHERGYVTVGVTVPQQKLTNATVKLQVLEGRLADIKVVGNHYFSSNNVMRALPSLHTNMVLNGPIFNDELGQANANQDRQIYPVIGPGPQPGTSELALNVKDRLPLHARAEFDNQSSPGTPALRVDTSAVYNNLWQQEHSVGVQYGFSPEFYKQGDQWNFFDRPLVAYYSGFYRLPLGNPVPVENAVASSPGNFGYNEATHQFNLPPPSGQPELNFYASRASIDTDVQTVSDRVLVSTTNLLVTEQTLHQDLTINEDVGFQLSKPLPEFGRARSILSGGLDFKVYNLTSYATNVFTSISVFTNGSGGFVTNPPAVTINSVPTTHPTLDYLPLALNYNMSLPDDFGPATFGLGFSANLWYSSQTEITTSTTSGDIVTYQNGLQSLQGITGSQETTGHWLILRPSFSQDIYLFPSWKTSVRTDGQWASEPLVSNEQFGAGGVNSVRGYHEGEVFGDSGWHASLEQDTPDHLVGNIYDGVPLTVRGAIYMDYAKVFLKDPQGRPGSVPLWGTGFGVTASAGSHWQAQFLFSWPLLSAGTITAYQPFFNFALTGQF